MKKILKRRHKVKYSIGDWCAAIFIYLKWLCNCWKNNMYFWEFYYFSVVPGAGCWALAGRGSDKVRWATATAQINPNTL